MTILPTGTVTFLFTDIEGSTGLWQQFPNAMPHAHARHHEILHGAISGHGGHVFNIIGDAFCAAFDDANTALGAMLDAQRALFHEPWGEVGALRVRMGLHTGAGEPRDGDYVSSLVLVRVQRIMNAGHGGQMLLSPATADRVQETLPLNTTLRNLGAHKLRGLAEPETIYQLVAADLPSEFPPLRIAATPDMSDSAALLEQLVRGTLVGRAGELAQLEQHWDSSQQARAHLVMLSGEPGVGKTRLANELVTYAQGEGAMLLRGGCYEYEATTPYLPFLEALREWVRFQSADTLRAWLDTTAPEIAKLAPEIESKLGNLTPNPALEPNEERLRLYDNVARLFQKLAAPRGLLFFIDDLHWADQGTLHLLHYLLRHLRNDRVLLLAAYREIELDRSHPLAAALVEWNREHLVTRISLSRLSREDTGTLLATLFGQANISDEFVLVLYRETEGNPFFIEEVVKALIEQGGIFREDGGWGRKETGELAIPQSVKEAIGRRLDRLSEGCTEALRTAAALGKIFAFSELAAVTTVPEDELLDALDEATGAQLIKSGANDSFAFTHDKIREVLYEELNPIRRRRLHQRIADGLEKLYSPLRVGQGSGATPRARVPDLAYHFAQSGDVDKSLIYSVRAAEDAERIFAHDDALRFYQQAQEAAETLGQVDAVADIQEHIGDIYRLRGDISPAVVNYQRARAQVASPSQRAALDVKIGFAYYPIGDVRGLEALQSALVELDAETQSKEIAVALALIGRYYHYQTQHHRAEEYFKKALAIAEPLDDAETLENIYSFLSGTYQHIADFDSSNLWAHRNLALGERKNSPEASALGYEFLAENAFQTGRWDDAIRYAQLNRKIGIRIGSQARIAWAAFAESAGDYGKGELIAAKTAALAGLEIAEQLGENRLASWLETQLGIIYTDLGDNENAEMYGERSLVRSEKLGQLVLRAWALHGGGYRYLQWDENARAAELYLEGLKLVEASENRVALSQMGGYPAEALFKAEQTERALETAQAVLELVVSAKSVHHAAVVRRVQGQIWTAQQRWELAADTLDTAIAALEQLGSRLELARALASRGELLDARGDAARATQDREQARALLTQCGAIK